MSSLSYSKKILTNNAIAPGVLPKEGSTPGAMAFIYIYILIII